MTGEPVAGRRRGPRSALRAETTGAEGKRSEAMAVVPLSGSDSLPTMRLADTAEKARRYADGSRAAETKRAYTSDWTDFSGWCAEHDLAALPASPATVSLYVTDLAEGGYATATIRRRLSAIREAHRIAKAPLDSSDPAIRDVWRGILAKHGSASIGKEPVLTEDLRAMLDAASADVAGLRDRALLLLGFAGAFRRSELVGLDLGPGQSQGDDAWSGWIEFHPEGLKVHLARSKTDREGRGTVKGVPSGGDPATCPVAAVRAWVEAAGLAQGPLFRPIHRSRRVLPSRLTPHAVAVLVKRYAAAAGLDPARYSGHSLRSGHATQATLNDADERSIQNQLDHTKADMTRRYVRIANVFRRSSARKLGL